MEIYLKTETLREIESNLSPASYFQEHNTKTHSHIHVQRRVNQDLIPPRTLGLRVISTN